jgi:hypothetical protein
MHKEKDMVTSRLVQDWTTKYTIWVETIVEMKFNGEHDGMAGIRLNDTMMK